MDRSEKMKDEIPEKEFLFSGHDGCPGCGEVLALRYTLKALGKQTIAVITASCASTIVGRFPYTDLAVPALHCAFETAAITATGIKAGLEMKGDKETTVLAWAGDGGTFDIGLQSLSGAAERNEDIIYACCDNEAYMNTGNQRSSATPLYASTTTTPPATPKNTRKKDLVGIMVAHGIPYVATASIAYPGDLIAKVQKAKGFKGTKLIHILSPCPVGWGYPSELTIKMARLAVQTKVFPLYEVENGNYKITIQSDGTLVGDYVKLQSRFRHLKEQHIETIQNNVDRQWKELLRKTKSMTYLQ
jgi:pyruvate/2-oxoacid:ferredoxin oxidoreductase beta subunit